MLEELKDNLYEKNLDRIVDYGHEFGHVIEVLSNYELSHGEAVGIGMLISNSIAMNKNLMDESTFYEFYHFYRKLNLPVTHPKVTAYNLYQKTDSIRLHKNGKLSIVALEKIGHPIFINDFNYQDIESAMCFLNEEALINN